jgi:hypothetical protein
MVTCGVCGESVPYLLLRMEMPRCTRGHELGVWVACENPSERHVYLRKESDTACPVCGDTSYKPVARGVRVKCLHVSPAGPCAYPHYRWLEDGPPCHLNHLTKIALVTDE